MTEYNKIGLKTIQPIITQDIFKVFEEEMKTIIEDLCEKNKLNKEEVLKQYLPNLLNISIKLGVKKRNKRVLPKEVRCMGRKIDGEQCTRSRGNGCDYCKSHQKRLPHGRIDDDTYVKKVKGKRGRKKKSLESEYIATKVETINGVEYLVDEYENVFKYDLENSEYLGTKHDLIKKLEANSNYNDHSCNDNCHSHICHNNGPHMMTSINC
jgi:hypothetical protein